MTVRLRDAEVGDVPILLQLIKELAIYERREALAVATPELLQRHLFGALPRAHAMLAEQDGIAVGKALWFFSFSTFRGTPSLYVEDVYVRPEMRGQGIGRLMFAELSRRAVAAECSRMEWSVLNWNEPAIRFYRSLGAEALDEWTTQRLDGDALSRLVGE